MFDSNFFRQKVICFETYKKLYNKKKKALLRFVVSDWDNKFMGDRNMGV